MQLKKKLILCIHLIFERKALLLLIFIKYFYLNIDISFFCNSIKMCLEWNGFGWTRREKKKEKIVWNRMEQSSFELHKQLNVTIYWQKPTRCTAGARKSHLIYVTSLSCSWGCSCSSLWCGHNNIFQIFCLGCNSASQRVKERESGINIHKRQCTKNHAIYEIPILIISPETIFC